MLETLHSELICCHHNDFLDNHFKIKKTCELITRKYYFSNFCLDVKSYIKGYDVY